jgi:hypothetical protein
MESAGPHDTAGEKSPVEQQESALLERLEKRAGRLRTEGYCFLALIVMLLGFGAIVVYQAPQLTRRDAGGDTESRLTSTYNELDALNKRNDEINAELLTIAKGCPAYQNFFKQWPNQNQDDHQWHQINMQSGPLPSGKEIADKIDQALSQKELAEVKNIGFQILLPVPCGELFVSESRETFKSVLEATRQQDFRFDGGEKAAPLDAERGKVGQRISFLRLVAVALYNKEVADAANGNTSNDEGNTSGDDKGQLVRLVQTSITRFGTLIVVSFLVAILIPSYRYSMRLSAFYSARADALIAMRSTSFEISNFDLLTGVLTPHIEFGKSPSTPVEQVADLVRAARGIEGAQAKGG